MLGVRINATHVPHDGHCWPLLAIVVSHLPVLLPGKTSVLTFNCGILVAGVGGVETQGGNGRAKEGEREREREKCCKMI